jgi:hypothetical protein
MGNNVRSALIASLLGIVLVSAESCSQGASPAPAGSAVIGAAGGTLMTSDGSSLVIPPGALSAPLTITMTPADASSVPGGAASGSVFHLQPDGLQFLLPATLTLTVDPAMLAAGATASDVGIFTAAIGETSSAYLLSTSVVDPTHVSAQILHFCNGWPAIVPPSQWEWVAANNGPGGPARTPPTTNTCQGGAGGAVYVCIVPPCPSVPPCQCPDGTACPGGTTDGCCPCPDGSLCPFNRRELCATCGSRSDGGAEGGSTGTTPGTGTPTDSSTTEDSGTTEDSSSSGDAGGWCCCQGPVASCGTATNAETCTCNTGDTGNGVDCAQYCAMAFPGQAAVAACSIPSGCCTSGGALTCSCVANSIASQPLCEIGGANCNTTHCP